MDISDNEVYLAKKSKSLNDPVSKVEKRVLVSDYEFKLIIGMIFDTSEEGGSFYKDMHMLVAFTCPKQNIKMV